MTSLKKNLIYNMAYQILVILLPLITAPYVSRVLGAAGLGTYSYVYSISYYFGLVGMLGITNHGSRSIALYRSSRAKTAQTFWNIYFIQFISTGIAVVAYTLFALLLFNGNKIVAYINILFVVSYLLDINWLFFGLEQFRITVIRNTIIKVATAACIFIFVKSRDDLWLYTLIMALGASLSQIYLWLNVHKFVPFCKPDWQEVKKNIKPVVVLFIPAIAYSIYKVLDKIMLGAMSDMTQVGLFDNAERIVNIPVSLITAFGTVMLPRISNLIADGNSAQIKKYNAISFRYFTMLVCGAAFGLAGISNVLAPVYFGDEFIGSSPLIFGLSFSLIFMIWANIIRTQYLIPNQKDMPYVVSTLIGAVINIGINIMLIPYLQALGTMIGTILAEFSVFFVQLILTRKQFPVLRYLRSGLMFFLIGSFMGIAIWIVGYSLGTSIKTLLLQLIVGAVLYGIGSLVYLLLINDEILLSFINKLFGNKLKLNKPRHKAV
ncbi:oligosaccharide flippase family protein [Bifidobacterium sp. MA2]|uniref:Oligosaccharide flippase family protein n=1 Tax=Bifidobacterium santillanense TaxID=2809028 RepID=A0ABS5UQN9_9BIFI|nr:oligosaccharide flippase family protein [Bifidobacterium santillanense]MBT1173170.1 oligosaccharide flippase family protein [Bifidobacterium santillanense]